MKLILFISLLLNFFIYMIYSGAKPALIKTYHYANKKLIKSETFVSDDLKYGCETFNGK